MTSECTNRHIILQNFPGGGAGPHTPLNGRAFGSGSLSEAGELDLQHKFEPPSDKSWLRPCITFFIIIFYISLMLLSKNLTDLIAFINKNENESGFRPPLCTYRLNWARRTS